MDYGMWNDRTNMSMLTDFYELTMANGYLNSGNRDKIVYFDMFFRNIPENGGYAVMAGLEQVIDYLSSLKFSEDDLTFLKDNYHFNDEEVLSSRPSSLRLRSSARSTTRHLSPQRQPGS